jgi:hypothetical protein
MMGIITNKAKFINQVMTSKQPVRVAEDVDEMVLTYSQMQAVATGNPLIMEKIQLDNDVASLKMLKADYVKSSFRMQELAEKTLPPQIESCNELLEKAKEDLKRFKKNYSSSKEFSMTVGGRIYSERTKVGDEIEQAIIKCSATEKSIQLGSYRGFDLTIDKNPANISMLTSGSPCVATLHGNLSYSSDVSLNNSVGNVRRIENIASVSIEQKVSKLSEKLERLVSDMTEAKKNCKKPFEHQAELENKLKRLETVNALLSGKSTSGGASEGESVAQGFKAQQSPKASPQCILAGEEINNEFQLKY